MLLSLAAVLLAGAFWVSARGGIFASSQNKDADSSGLAVLNTPPSRALEVDSDRDGLRDWEETLWGTNPDNPDTDNDGTSDGNETRAGRDPKKPGSDDKLAEQQVPTAPEPYRYEFDKSLGSNLTQTFAINVLTNYVRARGAGKLQGPEAENAQRQMFTDLNKAVTIKTLVASDMLVGESDSVSVRKYFNETAKALTENQGAIGKETSLILPALTSKDYSLLKKIEPIADDYQEVTEQLKQISVPPQFVTMHLALTNDYFIAVQTLSNIATQSSDLIFVLVNFSHYRLASEDAQKQFVKLRAFVTASGLLFSPNEPAKIFTQ